jgi:hypothetical protein
MQTLYRKQYENYCLGHMTLPDGKEISILERLWLDNEPFVSCIPEGQYFVAPDTDGRFKYYELQDVPNRSFIEIHPANKVSQLEGCLAPCMEFNFATETASRSREACELLKKWFGDYEWYLNIVSVDK